jgi:hypothetical protein
LPWSAVINGFVAVPIMAAMMWLAGRRDQLGRYTVSLPVQVVGWSATALMGTAALSMLRISSTSMRAYYAEKRPRQPHCPSPCRHNVHCPSARVSAKVMSVFRTFRRNRFGRHIGAGSPNSDAQRATWAEVTGGLGPVAMGPPKSYTGGCRPRR